MTRFVGTPVKGVEFANAGDEAISARVSGDSNARLRIDAGGRLTWGDGSGAGDVNLYRSDATTLKTDDTLYASNGVITLTTIGKPTANLPDGAMAIDTNEDRLWLRSQSVWVKAGSASVELSPSAPTTNVSDGDMWFDTDDGILYVRSSGSWVSATGALNIDSLADVDAGSPTDGQVLQYNTSTAMWEASTFYALPAGGNTGQVLTKNDNSDYNYSWQDVISADGGSPTTWLRAHVSIDAGGV
ncbi:MAG: hypothetical protein O3A30_03875 [Bacteroidetes bacterium]|nr:hypothetical protein [Bacteroidota bacterium]